ncbi:acyltransferase family-domain-containing protein [Amylocarpus encephaloides]|uniref:Acyltransferase family-domain-containing protein n=1 Tax=Amylocarpus encephaloides TaxID=45428 RepID=A0A9P8C2D6_9HELO|nr:acyltransferase family-domain-containing protein [Amylocarpus encephaloides]
MSMDYQQGLATPAFGKCLLSSVELDPTVDKHNSVNVCPHSPTSRPGHSKSRSRPRGMIQKHQSRALCFNTHASSPSDETYYNMLSLSRTKVLQRTIFGFLPSCITRRIRPLSSRKQKLHPTSYLDGLRGIASFIVFMGHYTEENLGWYTEPYGMYEDGAPSSPLQLPFIRVLYSARPMVHIFFIISGFVLAYKPIMQIHSQQYSSLANTLSSSVFRRALRLFLPSICTLFFMALAVYYGISDERYAHRYFTLSSQLENWWQVCWWLLNTCWSVNNIAHVNPTYNPALWTIPIEFSQSMILFIVLIGLAQCRTQMRLLLLAGIMILCFYGGILYSVEFLGGMFIAEVMILNDGRVLGSPASSPKMLPKYSLEDAATLSYRSMIKEKAMQVFWIMNVLSGLFIASWTNDHPNELWGIRFLNTHTPKPYKGQEVWFCFGAFQIVIACTQLKCLQNIFNTGIAQYLGNVSYALYLTHNLCLTALEPRIAKRLKTIFDLKSSTSRHLFWAAGLTIYLPFILWVADIFWRAIDIPSVKFARWLESKCIVEKPSKR